MTKWIVCPHCKGSGTCTMHGVVFTAEDIAEDPEFFEAYANGSFDEPCMMCNGRTTVTQEQIDEYNDLMQEARTVAMESGYYGGY